MFVRKPLFYMSDDGGNAGAGEGGAGDSGSASGGAGGDAGGDQGGKSTDDGKTFTQADVERIIAGRLNKFADYDEIKNELTEVKKANQTETEKAIDAARTEARAEAIREAAPRLVGAEFRAALAGRRTADEVAALIEDLDLSKYLTEAGEVDAERVAKKADLLAPPSEERKTAPSFGGGARKAGSDKKSESSPGIGRLRDAYASSSK